MQIIVNDLLVEYTDQGSGPVLICLHGWMMNKESFSDLAKELSPRMRIIVIDLPNFGKSQMAESITTVTKYAEFVQAFVNKLGVAEYSLAGHSMGGQIAIYGISEGILQPRHLILLAAAGVRDERKVSKLFLKIASKLLGPLLPEVVKKRFYAFIGSDYNPELSPIHKKVIKEVLGTDIQKNAQRVHTPTLLLYGSLDTSTPPKMGRTLASLIASSKLEVIEGENHWLQQTAAPVVGKYIEEFMTS